ncbi:MAG TPA: glycosyltransferase family 39 protein [Terriglobales bacterium]|jgi:mannosyltransferase|nr:glycosyltransferase family 39 protein [Terriglobales bacterium]
MPAGRETTLADRRTTHSVISQKQLAILLSLLTIAGAWLRLSHLGSKSLWLDEGATVALARASWQHFWWVWWHGEANLQTIYFLLMRGWIHLGDGEAWLRLPSALFGIASIPAMYVVARRLVSTGPALGAAALLAFSPADVYYSQEARSYTLAILLVLLSTYFFVRAVEQCQRRDWAWWMWISTLAFYTHDFAALVLIAQACSMLFKPEPQRWRPLLIRGTIILLLALPGLTYVLRASPENLHFAWMPQPSPREFLHLAAFYAGGGLKLAIASVLWIAGVIAIWYRGRSGEDANAFWHGTLVVLWAVLPAILLAIVSLREPLFLQRYVIFSLPAWALLAAIGADLLRKWKVGLVLLILLCGTSIPAIVNAWSKPREDWRAACNVVLGHASPGDAVVFFPFYSRIMLDYYQSRYPANVPPLHVFAPGYYAAGEGVQDLMRDLDTNPRQFRHVWVFVAGQNKSMRQFDGGATLMDKLSYAFGTPVVHVGPDFEVAVLEYGK